jgi:excisionase family DNA binding protein
MTDGQTDERAYTVAEACARLGDMSRTKFYAEVRAGRIDARKSGSRTVVLQSEINRYLRDLPPASNGD